jgi:hypothetical protein
MPNVILSLYNTVAITAASGVYRLKLPPGAGGLRQIDLLNLGPGAIFIRADKDPTSTDMNSLQLPSNWAINAVNVESTTGLGVIASADTTIGVRAK